MTIHIKSAVVLLAGSLSSMAEIKMPAFFSDGMVLQQQTGAKVWGSGDAGETVQVEFAGQKLTSKTGENSMWMVDFKDLKMSKTGATMTISSGKDKHVIKDVVVGEVWLASGQSNMEWTMNRTTGAEDAKTANDSLLRIYVSKNVTAVTPVNDFEGSWKKTQPENTSGFTAVGYEFAKNLRKKLDVPVGIIECSWGGKPVESFVSVEALKALPEAKVVIDKKAALVAKYDPLKAKQSDEANMKKWKMAAAEWKKTKKGKQPRKPRMASNPALNSSLHSTIYNGMIAPIVGYGARGAIWYQGESNANPATGPHYGELLKCLVQDWRKAWGSDLSFYYVQLANFTRGGKDIPNWVVVQDEMRRLLDECDGVGMAVINDIGHPTNIHPSNKKDVGERLARWALSKDYGDKEMVVSGPLYKSHAINGATVEVSFSHSAGIKARDGKALGEFELSDANGNWHPAEAMIKGEKIIVSSKLATKPSNIRFAWKSDPTKANLVNAEGLPTSCFVGK